MKNRLTKKMKWYNCPECEGRVYKHRTESHICICKCGCGKGLDESTNRGGMHIDCD